MNLAYRKAVDRALAKRSQARSAVRSEKELLAESSQALADSRAALELAQSLARSIQAKVCGCVAGVVSRCLAAIFQEPYEFTMEFVERRGRTEVELGFSRGGQKLDPVTAAGGGVVDVASFALRLSALLLSGSKARRILVLDEPFRFVSRSYLPRLRDLLVELSKEMGVQILMVTHIEELEVGTVIEIGG